MVRHCPTEVVNNIDENFAAYAVNDRVTFEAFKELLTEVDNGLRAYPATAQVAKQAGPYSCPLVISSAQL